MLRVSFLTLGSFLLAARLRVHDGMVVTALVFLCSVNHWRRPVYGWRRRLDIATTFTCLAFQSWRSTHCAHQLHQTGFLVCTYAAVACFLVRVACCRRDPLWGVRLQSAVHVLGNAGNAWLYFGLRGVPAFGGAAAA